MSNAQYYEYKLPEDYVFKPDVRLKFDNLVDELYLSQIQAQRFLDLHVEMMEEYAEELEIANAGSKAEYLPAGVVD